MCVGGVWGGLGVDKSMLLNCKGVWGLDLVSKAAGLEASPSNHPQPPLLPLRTPLLPAPHSCPCTKNPAMAMNLGGTCLHFLHVAVSPLSRPTYLITIKITPAAMDGAPLSTHSVR